jgi:enediyne biosynthesis protein E4
MIPGRNRSILPRGLAPALLTLVAVVASRTTPVMAADLLEDATLAVGVDFVHFNGMSGQVYAPEIVGSGVALFDFDGDGDLDIYFVQSTMLGPDADFADATFAPRHPRPLTDRLYRNDLVIHEDGTRDLRFTDVTLDAEIPPAIYGMGVSAGDFDGDGDSDLFITGFGSRRLLSNDGDGTFTDVTTERGLDGDGWSVPSTFFDFDADGDLDLFVGRYTDYDFPPPRACGGHTDFVDYCSPQAYPDTTDQLFRNDDGYFVDVTVAAGMGSARGPALGATAADFDLDGDLDLYVANDGAANRLWMNLGAGQFADDALLAGVALNADGMAEASMGVDAADFDGDGDDDLFMTHLTKETNTLYVNDGTGLFDDRTGALGLGAASYPYTSFGTVWSDFDNDGWLDLFVANGSVYIIGALMEAGDPYPLHQPNQVFRNLGNGRFEDVSATSGAALTLSEVSRGAAVGDLDNDGDPDLVLVNNSGPARVLLNRVGQESSWIGFDLRDSSGRHALGARVEITRDPGASIWRRVRTDGSYASSNDPRVLIGLGTETGSVSGRIHWPDGTSTAFNLEPGRYHLIAEMTP